MSYRKEVIPEYIYLTIPAEYVCVYHRIMAMLADYGEEMLKDCKAACTDRNSGVIECFNMFNAACAARLIGQDKKAQLIINYIKAKINQIYKGKDNSTSYVFPIDENGKLKAFVSCNDRPRFVVNIADLYKQEQNLGFDEEYSIDDEIVKRPFFDFDCSAEVIDNHIQCELYFYINDNILSEEEVDKINIEYYINGKYIPDLTEEYVEANITCNFRVVAMYGKNIMAHTYVLNMI